MILPVQREPLVARREGAGENVHEPARRGPTEKERPDRQTPLFRPWLHRSRSIAWVTRLRACRPAEVLLTPTVRHEAAPRAKDFLVTG